MESGDTPALLELRGITKRFPGIVANDRVDLDLRAGEVHALLGENGAGKSTLMNVLYGLYAQDEGEIYLNGEQLALHGPKEAIEHGIGMVHQHFQLIPVLTVAENIVLGAEPRNGIRIDMDGAIERVEAIAERFGLPVEPRRRVEEISVGQQQRAEILKALYRGAKILILDEPTAVLSPQESRELFVVLRQLVADGMAIIFISHKLNEVLALADRVSVLRRGAKVSETIQASTATAESLASLMVGRAVDLSGTRRPTTGVGDPALVVHDLSVYDDRNLEVVRDVSFEVRQGEIVAIAGVDGNGQTELIQAIAGLRRPSGGTIALAGKDVTGESPKAAIDGGIGHIPEDRHRHGLILEFTLAENVVLPDHDTAPISRHGWMFPDAMAERADRLITEFDVRGGGASTLAGALSGGNQQKVVVAREVDREPKLLIAAQPVRGLDIGAVEFVHEQLIGERDAGRGVLLLSFELDEVLSLADRILVMFEGRIVLEREGGKTTREEIGIAMAGGQVTAGAA